MLWYGVVWCGVVWYGMVSLTSHTLCREEGSGHAALKYLVENGPILMQRFSDMSVQECQGKALVCSPCSLSSGVL